MCGLIRLLKQPESKPGKRLLQRQKLRRLHRARLRARVTGETAGRTAGRPTLNIR